MLNKALFFREWKSNYKTLLIFCGVLTLYISLIVFMFDPELGSALHSFSESMPELMALFGMSDASSTLVGFISTYLYGMLLIALPMVYIIMLAGRLVVRHIDRGSMAYLLSGGDSRATLISTQAVVLVSHILTMLLYCFLLGWCCSAWMFPNQLDFLAYLRLHTGLICLQLAIGGFCFLVSCTAQETKNAYLVSAGVPVVFLLIQMLANMGGDLEPFQYVTPFSLFDRFGLIEGAVSAYTGSGALLLSGSVFFIVGTAVFRRRDLPV